MLEVQGNYAKILHETVIVNEPFHHTREEVTWAASSSRVWLNGEFFNSFSAADRARIRETYVVNSDNPWTSSQWAYRINAPGGANTTDRIFLLSIEEVVRYFGNSGMLERGRTEINRDVNVRLRWPEHALYYWGMRDQFNTARIADNDAGEASWWRLRSPGFRQTTAAVVDTAGEITMFRRLVTDSSDRGGLRPALWLNLES
ncbi:MAG: DUF6273 domain-containing protein [Defluviitaleaceae bacterium]|nr:DUF6273 domain-containing protein [Defluviitaleaceae bacterium]